jgi:hypothetical protein
MVEDQFEIVYTVTDYYDGPRAGIADFNGSPHYYECLFDDSKGYLDIFQLSPIEHETFQLALEDWAIWRRWKRAYHEGLADQSTHPALPRERQRHEELQVILERRLKIKEDQAIQAKGDFEPMPRSQALILGMIADLKVKWTLVETRGV